MSIFSDILQINDVTIVRDIYNGTLVIEFERDLPVGLGATLGGDGQKIKNYFSSFRDFFGKNPLVSYCWASNVGYYKPTKFIENRWSHF